MTERRQRERTLRKWIAIAGLATLVLYPLSFGPVCWMAFTMDRVRGENLINNLYGPVRWIHQYTPQSIREAIERYATVKEPRCTVWVTPARIYIEDPSAGLCCAEWQ